MTYIGKKGETDVCYIFLINNLKTTLLFKLKCYEANTKQIVNQNEFFLLNKLKRDKLVFSLKMNHVWEIRFKSSKELFSFITSHSNLCNVC